jgi:hypothetical protein
LDICGIASFSALLIVAELGEVERFCTAKQVGRYKEMLFRAPTRSLFARPWDWWDEGPHRAPDWAPSAGEYYPV